MSSLTASIHDALDPYVGPMVADTCLRATAISVGKTSEDLGEGDLPVIESNIRKLLLPVAPQAAIESMLSTLRWSVVR